MDHNVWYRGFIMHTCVYVCLVACLLANYVRLPAKSSITKKFVDKILLWFWCALECCPNLWCYLFWYFLGQLRLMGCCFNSSYNVCVGNLLGRWRKLAEERLTSHWLLSLRYSGSNRTVFFCCFLRCCILSRCLSLACWNVPSVNLLLILCICPMCACVKWLSNWFCLSVNLSVF